MPATASHNAAGQGEQLTVNLQGPTGGRQQVSVDTHNCVGQLRVLAAALHNKEPQV